MPTEYCPINGCHQSYVVTEVPTHGGAPRRVSDLPSHLQAAHPFACLPCNYDFGSPEELAAHQQTFVH